MCVNSCIAFTGPYEPLLECPKCHEPRHRPLRDEEEDTPSKCKPQECVTTLLPGGVVQAFWSGEETALDMMYLLLAAAGLGQSQWPVSSSKKSDILTKAKLHTYVEL